MLNRPELKLANLDGNDAVKAVKAAISAAIQNGQKPPSTEAYWSKDDVRGALIAFQGCSCIWCDDKLEIKRGVVDHYRPRALYPWPAYEWANLFWCCNDCNEYKGDDFPLEDDANRAGPKGELHHEAPVIPDPNTSSLEDLFVFERRSEPPFIILKAKNQDQGAKYLIEHLGIDGTGRTKLDGRRNKIIDQVHDFIAEDKQAEAQVLASRYRPHSWFARAILSQNRPDWLPCEREDVYLLTELLIQELQIEENDRAVRAKHQTLSARREKRYRRLWSRLRFALAVLSLFHADKDVIWAFIQKRVSSKNSLVQIKKYRSQLQKLNPTVGLQKAT